MEFLESADTKLVCSDLSSKLNMIGWYNVPVDHISVWDNDIFKDWKEEAIQIHHDTTCSSLG
jgi:hypothetical protein